MPNMSAAIPATKKTAARSETKYGIQLTDPESEMTIGIMLDRNGCTDKIYDLDLIENNRESIDTLYEKANEMWGIYSWN